MESSLEACAMMEAIGEKHASLTVAMTISENSTL